MAHSNIRILVALGLFLNTLYKGYTVEVFLTHSIKGTGKSVLEHTV